MAGDERFWQKVKIYGLDDCWEWQGYIDMNGYGCTSYGNQESAHREAYMLVRGKITSYRCVCHSCDNRKCVNPTHLWLGTHKENMMDAHNKHVARKNILSCSHSSVDEFAKTFDVTRQWASKMYQSWLKLQAKNEG